MSDAKQAARLAASALASIRSGDATCIATLKPLASTIAPDKALELLVAAALGNDAAAIDALFNVFGRFEMPSVALARALGLNLESASRALIAHSVELGSGFLPADIDNDTDAWRVRRHMNYLDRMLPCDFRAIPGKEKAAVGRGSREPGLVYRIAVSSENEALLGTLAREHAFSQRDLDGLMFAALIDGAYGLARALASTGANPDAAVLFMAAYGPGWRPRTICGLADLFYNSAPPELARTLVDLAPERAQDLWSPGLAQTNPETARILVPFLNPVETHDARGLARRLAELGYAAELACVLRWDLPGKRTLVQAALEAATAARQTETQLLCMNALAALDPAAGADDLEL